MHVQAAAIDLRACVERQRAGAGGARDPGSGLGASRAVPGPSTAVCVCVSELWGGAGGLPEKEEAAKGEGVLRGQREDRRRPSARFGRGAVGAGCGSEGRGGDAHGSEGRGGDAHVLPEGAHCGMRRRMAIECGALRSGGPAWVRWAARVPHGATCQVRRGRAGRTPHGRAPVRYTYR